MEPDLQQRPAQMPGEILAFLIRKETKCSECGEELWSGRMITLNRERGALCLGCAELDHLEFLARGDAAVTRRATKYSRLKAVVLQWSRTRKRYERQGILAEIQAIEKAETECLADADRRRRQAERRRVREAELNEEFVTRFVEAIMLEFPGCPPQEATRIAEHACLKSSGRVGRSAAAKRFDPEPVRLAVVAAVRHQWTDYDRLLQEGLERREARALVSRDLDQKLEQWSRGNDGGLQPIRPRATRSQKVNSA